MWLCDEAMTKLHTLGHFGRMISDIQLSNQLFLCEGLYANIQTTGITSSYFGAGLSDGAWKIIDMDAEFFLF